ncbi:MAG: RloB domain-containing protein [Rhodopirellula sp.]|nr:RloB domain-containing protein [Rhodopirellula sp.]
MKKYAFKRRVLIVGEGRETEYNYFVGFRNTFEQELEATATSVKVTRGKGGDARAIVKNAIKEAKKFKPDRKRGDRVFLLLDTEGVGRAPELPAAEKLAKERGIEIIYSCPSFEYWLLCHFENISRGHFNDCDAVVNALNKKWNTVCKTTYDKADQDIFDRLSSMLNVALVQALDIDLHHLHTKGGARRTNPSAQVYELIAILIGAGAGEKCPIAGTWKLVGDAPLSVQLNKGDKIPPHKDNSAHWQL